MAYAPKTTVRSQGGEGAAQNGVLLGSSQEGSGAVIYYKPLLLLGLRSIRSCRWKLISQAVREFDRRQSYMETILQSIHIKPLR